jgi:DNA-binding transcriptional regulator YiaG
MAQLRRTAQAQAELDTARTARTEDGRLCQSAMRAIRSAFRLRQDEAARIVGVSRTLWSAWEQRSRPINVDQLLQVRRAFDLTDDELAWVVEWWGTIGGEAPLTLGQLVVTSRAVGVSPVVLLKSSWGE